MKAPLIFITYGLTKRICSYEENEVHKIPVFTDLELAYKFTKEFQQIISDEETAQPQICNNDQYILDILKLINIKVGNLKVSYNIGGDDHKEYDIDEAIEIIESSII